ncbi:MAG: RDD family protein [Hyphomicrobiales bacterium]
MTAIDRMDIPSRAELYDGIVSRRVFAYIFDIVIVSLVSIVAAIAVFFLGIFTFGLAWLLFLIFMPLVLAAYLAFTLGGPDAATPGMKMAGIQMRLYDGGRSGPLGAMLHGLLFYISITVLTPFIILVGLFTARGRLLHDLVLGTYVVRSDYL